MIQKINQLMKCIGVGIFVLVLFEIANVIQLDVADTIYAVLCFHKKVTIMQGEIYWTIATTVKYCTQIGFTVWFAFLFSKSGILEYKRQGISKETLKFSGIFIGLILGILIDASAMGMIVLLGRKIVTNYISGKILFNILMGVPSYLSVGIYEEFVFRGVIQGYCDKQNKRVFGIILSTFAFVLIHLMNGVYNKSYQIVFLIGLSLMFSAMREYTGSIWMCMACHGAYDWAVFHLMELRIIQTNNCFFSLFGVGKTSDIFYSITVVALVIAVIFTVLIILRRKKDKKAEAAYGNKFSE